MTTFPIPDEALASHIAVLGKTGSGKTTTSKGIIEHVVPQGYRVCILDPIKSDWWGITSSADGKRAGLPFTILGGPRGHVPLHATSGKVLADLVGKGTLPHSILDMANFRPGEHQRFFVDFAERLMKSARGVLYLVMEEAHFFAPKERAGISGENMAIYWAKMLATAGRAKGIRLIVLTQRTQALHNALLGSCETMIVHRITAPADQDPVQKWLKANVSDKALIKRIDDEMSSLTTGTAWLCSGEAKVFDLVKFPRIRTFDNSATPGKDGSAIDVKTAAVDQDKLRGLIGEAVAEADASDPAKLKARIAELERAAKQVPVAKPDDQAVAAAHNRGHQEGYVEGQIVGRADGIRQLGVELAGKLRATVEVIEAHIETTGATLRESIAAPTPVRNQAKPVASATAPYTNGKAVLTQMPAAGSAASDLSASQLKILEAVAACNSFGFPHPTRDQVGAFAGYSANGGRFGNLLGSLRTAGLIDYPTQGTLALTSAGQASAPPADLSMSPRDRLAPVLNPSQAKIIDALPSDGSALTRAQLGDLSGYDAAGGRFGNLLGSLRTLGVITYPAQGHVAVEPWVWG